MISYVLVAAALAVLVGPLALRVAGPMLASRPAARGVAFESAIHDLSSVRRRLAQTGHLADAEVAAIDALTLALVRGSDK